MVELFNKKVDAVPTGRQVRQASGNDLNANRQHIARLDADLANNHSIIIAQAQREAQAPNVSADTLFGVQALSRTADDSLHCGRHLLNEAMQACTY